jgi:hypothetical protein
MDVDTAISVAKRLGARQHRRQDDEHGADTAISVAGGRIDGSIVDTAISVAKTGREQRGIEAAMAERVANGGREQQRPSTAGSTTNGGIDEQRRQDRRAQRRRRQERGRQGERHPIG